MVGSPGVVAWIAHALFWGLSCMGGRAARAVLDIALVFTIFKGDVRLT